MGENPITIEESPYLSPRVFPYHSIKRFKLAQYRGAKQCCDDFATALRWNARGSQSSTALTPYPYIQMGTSVYIGYIGNIGYIGYSVDRPDFDLKLATQVSPTFTYR